MGIRGQKGRVHVHFGEPLQQDFTTPNEVAVAIDRQIVQEYRLQPSNIWAYEQQTGRDDWQQLPDDVLTELGPMNSDSKAAFQARLAGIPEAHRAKALAIYANPVIAKLSLRAAETG